jgi:hypothetical protein
MIEWRRFITAMFADNICRFLHNVRRILSLLERRAGRQTDKTTLPKTGPGYRSKSAKNQKKLFCGFSGEQPPGISV